MVQFLLNDHSDQAICPETHFLDLFWAKHRELDLRKHEDRALFWAEFTASKWFGRLKFDADEFCARAGDAAFADFRALFLAVLEAYAASQGKARIGDKTPTHYRHLDTIFEWFPDARVVFL